MVEEVLKKAELRLTEARKAVLLLFLQSKVALSHSDLENNLGAHFDRVTLYRTLNTFLEKDIIHKIIDQVGVAQFALCKHSHQDVSSTHTHEHNHNHGHFVCTQCKEMTCIEDYEIELPTQLLKGYEIHQLSVVIEGVCPRCLKQSYSV